MLLHRHRSMQCLQATQLMAFLGPMNLCFSQNSVDLSVVVQVAMCFLCRGLNPQMFFLLPICLKVLQEADL
jgi:hypothetical protein